MGKRKIHDPKQSSLFEKKVPQMPEGYYSGDKPNPNLRAFVEAHVKERPYDLEADDYQIQAFDRPIDTTKATAIYNMHTYWSKKPYDAIRQYVQHYTQPGDLILDPLCGSGGTALAALFEDRKAIAIDSSPAATFITKNYCTPVDVKEVRLAFEKLRESINAEVKWLYETRCDRCDGEATAAYMIYSQAFQCTRCLERVILFYCVEEVGRTAKGKPKKIRVCPYCHDKGVIEEIDVKVERFEHIPVASCYTCNAGCKPSRDVRHYRDSNRTKREYFRKYDLGKVEEIDALQIPYWLPRERMMNTSEDDTRWGILWRPYHGKIAYVTDFFFKRELWAISLLRDKILKIESQDTKDCLLFILTAMMLNVSKMVTNRDRLGFLKGFYYVPPICRIQNAFRAFETKTRGIVSGLKAVSETLYNKSLDLCISTADARTLSDISTNAIDYIFTDPPYIGKVQFGEANFVWESWLEFDLNWLGYEIIVNDVRGISEEDWSSSIRKVFEECYRVLKPGRWISVCYHDSSAGSWEILQDVMFEIGFIPDSSEHSLYIDTGQKTQKQKVSEDIQMRDLVVNFRKPRAGETHSHLTITGDEDKITFRQKVHSIVREYLSRSPGATKDRIYDEVVSRMVRAGRMEVHNFEELLRQVADEVKQPVMKDLLTPREPDHFESQEISRWYLKETELDKVDAAESAKEDTAAEKMRAFITNLLGRNPELEGVHYSDLLENYIYTVRDKPRRPLAEWLLDYFYKTESGTYRLPASEEEEHIKAEGRARGTIRRVKRYLAFLEQGVVVPDKESPNDATLAEWIRHCKRSGMYEQGKILYEKGGLNLDNLSEDLMVNVEEDYDVCVRNLGRMKKSMR